MSADVMAQVQHPGFYIKAELDERGWAQSDLAYILGKSVQQLNAILSGKVSVTADTAVLLGEAFDMPPEFFTNLENQYQLSKAKAKASHPDVRKRAWWQSAFPVREMIKRGWIEETDPSLLDVQMMRFFEKNRLDDIPYVNSNAEVAGFAARKTDPYKPRAEELAWLYRVRQLARHIHAPKYSPEKLAASLSDIRTLMADPEDVVGVNEYLNRCGVRFVIVESLPKAKIDGVCTWFDTEPVIAITNRYDRIDNFWFVLRHEIEHVLQGHGRDQGYMRIDNLDGENGGTGLTIAEEERVANAAAADFCIPADQLQSFIARKSPYISEKDVIGFARRMEVHPAIAVGQLQHNLQKWNFLRKYQRADVSGIRNILISEFRQLNIIDGWDVPASVEL